MRGYHGGEFEVLGLARRRQTDSESEDFTGRRRVVVAANGRTNPLTQWAVGLVLAAVLLGWAGFFFFARASMAETKLQVKHNHAVATENSTQIRVIGSRLQSIAEDIHEIKTDVKDLKER
jgi:hypothetical protein